MATSSSEEQSVPQHHVQITGSGGVHVAAFANSAGINSNCPTSCNLAYGDSQIVE